MANLSILSQVPFAATVPPPVEQPVDPGVILTPSAFGYAPSQPPASMYDLVDAEPHLGALHNRIAAFARQKDLLGKGMDLAHTGLDLDGVDALNHNTWADGESDRAVAHIAQLPPDGQQTAIAYLQSKSEGQPASWEARALNKIGASQYKQQTIDDAASAQQQANQPAPTTAGTPATGLDTPNLDYNGGAPVSLDSALGVSSNPAVYRAVTDNLSASDRAKAESAFNHFQNLDTSERAAAYAHLRDVAAQAPVYKQAGLQTPHWASLVLAGIGALADPTHAAQIFAAPFNAQLADRERQQKLNETQFDVQSRQHAQDLDLVKMGVDQADQTLREQRQADIQGIDFYNNRALAGERSQDRELQRQQINDQKNEATSNTLLQRYYGSKSLPEMQDYAKRYNAKQTDPALQKTPEQVAGDWEAASATRVHSARIEFGHSLDRYINAYGEVDGSNLKDLIAERANLATTFGVDPKDLQSIPTGESLKKQAQADRKDEFAKRLTFLGQKQTEDLAFKQANLDLANRRLQQMTSNQGFMQQIAAGNLALRDQYQRATGDYRAASLALRQGIGNKTTGAIKTLDEKLSGLNKAIGDAKLAGNAKKVQALASQQSTLSGQRDFLIQQLPPEEQAQDFAANFPMFGTGQQVYQQPQQPAPLAVAPAPPPATLSYGGGNNPNNAVKVGGVSKSIAQHLADANKAIAAGANPQQVADFLRKAGITVR